MKPIINSYGNVLKLHNALLEGGGEGVEVLITNYGQTNYDYEIKCKARLNWRENGYVTNLYITLQIFIYVRGYFN